jgi:CheY-like chemotaxis protein
VTSFPRQHQVPESQIDIDSFSSEFAHLVRSALAHLYDHAYLQNHPLASMLDLGIHADQVTQAQGMRRLLLECIEMLRPEGDRDLPAAARAYAILTYRYVDGLSMQEIADKLALSRRQAYREHRKGLNAVASLLWNRVAETTEDSQPVPSSQGTAEDRLEVAQGEVARLRQAVHPEFLDLQQILAKVFNLLAPLAQVAGVQIRMSSPDSWPAIVADRVILRQTLLNLLSHALQVSQGDLVIAASRDEGGLLITVCDSPSASAPKTPACTEPDEVSLAVAQALVEVQGGYLEMGTGEGQWRARIVLPTSGEQIILVIDDNTDIIALFERYLAGHQVHVVGAIDGVQALSLAADLQPQAITLDIMMPSQDGWEILQSLKSSSDTQHIPVVVCSVLNEPQLAISMGADDYITKPVNQVELLQVLRRWMGPLRPAA